MDINEVLAMREEFESRRVHLHRRFNQVVDHTQTVKEVMHDVNTLRKSYGYAKTLLDLLSQTK